MTERYSARFKDAPWFKTYEIVVGGTGGIGSWASFMLARVGHSLSLFDFDIVEADNIGGQLFQTEQIGQYKTTAIAQTIGKFTADVEVNRFDRFDEDNGLASRIMFSCFDNMAARKVFFDKWLKNYHSSEEQRNSFIKSHSVNGVESIPHLAGPRVFIDARLEAETGIVYCIKNEQEAEKWLSEWFPDDRLANAPCTFRATSHNAAIIAGLMVGHLNNVVTNFVEGMDIRVTPWKTTYELPTFTFNSEELQPASS